MPKVRKAVIPAAGRGTRQFPASLAIRKEWFPLVDRDGLPKPIIQMICEEAIASGIDEICIIGRPGDEPLYRDYFRRVDDAVLRTFRDREAARRESENLAAIGQRLHFVQQSAQEGFGHAVY